MSIFPDANTAIPRDGEADHLLIHFLVICASSSSNFLLKSITVLLNGFLFLLICRLPCTLDIILFFSLVIQSCLTLCSPMDCSMPHFPVHHQHLELAQTHVHWVGDAIQLFNSWLSPSPAFNLSQHQCLFQWVSSSHQVAKVLEFQLQHQSFQWIFRTDFL